MGQRRGRGESISLHEAYQRLTDQHAAGTYTGKLPTYEVFRRIRNGHSRISDDTASALATMLDVHVDVVYAAARMRPRLGRFELPTRADRLDGAQRQVVLSVVDAILDAAGQAPSAGSSNVTELRAARTTGKLSKGQQRQRNADRAGEPDPDDPTDMEPR